MQRKVEKLSEQLAQAVHGWDAATAVSLADTADVDVYDPYFSLALDVYCRGEIPPQEERGAAFRELGAVAFESSRTNRKDRFLLEELPVRVEYKQTAHIDAVITDACTPEWLFKEKGTYMFYRLQKGHILRDEEGWLAGRSEQVQGLPDSFWRILRQTSQTRMEHYLSDLGAAVFRQDQLYFLVSLSGFMRGVCKTLFALNRAFEPSPRMFTAQVSRLDLLPPGFQANYNSLLRSDTELDNDRKWELANLLAKSIVDMQGLF